MMLARFFRLQKQFSAPKYAGKTPVFLVMGDFRGGCEANYHGTTILAQTLRGMWPELSSGMEKNGLFRAIPVAINDFDDFNQKVEQFDSGTWKIAGFIHELVLMNYGGIALTPEYVTQTDRLCQERDIPVFVDEIQSCMWSPELFLFKEYESRPDFVSVGKGFPGGMYPASKILTTAAMDNLNQFGALVTNGQEELASLSNLITIRFAEANAERTRAISGHWRKRMEELLEKYPRKIVKVEGRGLLSSLFFHDTRHGEAFGRALGEKYGIDAGVQTYKADCPPAVLSKFPLISSIKVLDFAADAMDNILKNMEE